MNLPQNLQDKINQRLAADALRQLGQASGRIDFASNDYLGFACDANLFASAQQLLETNGLTHNGATGSRLLSGNHALYGQTEAFIAGFHQSPSALLFNSGYDANLGLFSSVPQKGDVILYDELCHASIRDGMRLSYAQSYKFIHNDLEDLERLLEKFKDTTNVYIATESVFSMDGDSPNLELLCALAQRFDAYLIIDEAHALGVFGDNGCGLVQQLGLQDQVFARVMTFGKGLGCHGAAILGSAALQTYLLNFARSFIYTTGLPPHAVATIWCAYQKLANGNATRAQLTANVAVFNQQKNLRSLKPIFVYSKSAIQCAVIPGNEKVKAIAQSLQQQGFDVKPILSPTVPQGQERLRICLHAYNSEPQIAALLEALASALY